MTISILKKFCITVLTILFVTACSSGGGGGGDGGGGGGGGNVSNKVGGTGIGTVTGFGSVIINDSREFDFDAGTKFLLDGFSVTENTFMQSGLGMVTRVDVGEDVSADFTSGTAVNVSADNLVKGPVTNLNPLQVLAQIFTVDGSTTLVNILGNDVGNLALGDVIEVSGYAGSTNIIRATRVELKGSNNQGLLDWKLTGPASNIDIGTFNVGNQFVNHVGVVPRNCGNGLVNGDLVNITASQDPTFNPGVDVLDTVTDVECLVPGLGSPDDAVDNVLVAEIEGIVTRIISFASFVVNSQLVVTDGATLYEGGSAAEVIPGITLEAEGDLNTNTGTLTAATIRFRATRVRIAAPVTVPIGGLGSSFFALDVIAVNTNALTVDFDGLVDGSGGIGNQQVEVRGFVDINGAVIATRVSALGIANTADVRLRGPVSMLVNPTFEILGVTIDAATATSLADNNGNAIPTLADFFNQISNGTPVEVDNGTFTSAPPVISNGDIRIDN